AAALGLAEKLAPAPDYSSRTGYDPAFLPGFKLPIPAVKSTAAGEKARLLRPARGADPFELKYEHFSIVMNRSRRMPFVTAVNIDGNTWHRVDRKTGHVGQAEAAGGEVWYVDKRLSPADQTDQKLYDGQQPHFFDRGHQVRREDPDWGAPAVAEKANADTFHFTNCCPQQKDFN